MHSPVAVDEATKNFILQVALTLHEQDFAFTVDGPDAIPWDVYNFRTSHGDHGMLALRIVNNPGEHVEIGFFRYGCDYTPDSIHRALCEDASN